MSTIKRKIVILLDSLQPGGLLVSLSEAMNSIDLEKFDITIYARRSYCFDESKIPDSISVIIGDDKSHYHRRPKALVLHICIFLSKLFKIKRLTDKYSKKLNIYVQNKKSEYPAKTTFKNGVDVAISYAIGICTEITVKINADRRYLFFHSSDPNFHRDMNERLFDKFDNIIAVSKSVQNMLKENYQQHSDRIALISNHINQNRICKLAEEYIVETEINTLIITSVIRIDKEKGADMIVETASLLKKSGVSFNWFIVGDGDCREEIENQIKNNNLTDNIIITGFKDNPYPYIKCCNLFVHPAYEESFGLAILEALLLGKAVISTDTMGARDVLDNGKYGLLVPIDAGAIYKGITELTNNPRLINRFEHSYNNINSISEKIYRERWNKILNGEVL